jgi:hypothetical protein
MRFGEQLTNMVMFRDDSYAVAEAEEDAEVEESFALQEGFDDQEAAIF